jgi:2-C-methyl-D-erythritol 4-phosphate cytidylyltransferase
VARGLAAVPPTAPWILVHDGVRPCITPELVRRVVEATRAHGAAVAALPVAETLKRGAEGWVKETVPRDGLWAIQTPQGFRAELLREAHRRAAADGILGTDDAALIERLGTSVRLVPGLPGNVKITHPEDLPLARRLLAPTARQARGARRPPRRAR